MNCENHSKNVPTIAGLLIVALVLIRACDSTYPVEKGKDMPFEVSASTYAWEVHDEGITNLLDNLQNMAAVNSVYLIALMHHEPRPYNSERFPHNPAREKWFAEDSRVSWHPDSSLYGRLRPALSDYAWLRDRDWLRLIVDSAHNRHMKAGVEISHTILSNQVLKANVNQDLIQRTIKGEPAMKWSGDYLPCLNNPDIQEYLVAIYTDLSRHYELDYIQTCMVNFATGGVEEGGCFCEACRKKASMLGYDMDAMKEGLLENPASTHYLTEWEAFRRKSVSDLYQKISEVIHEEDPGIDFRLNNWRRNPEEDGLYLEDIGRWVNSVRIMSYEEQEGDPGLLDHKKEWIRDVLKKTDDRIPVLAAIGVRNRAYPELIEQGIAAAIGAGSQGITLGHYDGAAFSILRAVRNGLSSSGITGITAVHGIEAEEMILDNYFPNPWNYEWCINTDGKGVAEYIFDGEEGRYHIRISYADEEGGAAQMRCLLNSREVDAWVLDLDINCWTTRQINEIALIKGDSIRIEGIADRNDWARLDHIEFVQVPLK